MVGDRRQFAKKYDNAITRHEQNKKYCPMQNQSVIKQNKRKTEKLLSYSILCPLRNLYQRNQIKTKFVQFTIYFNVACQVLVWFLPCT